MSGHHEPVGERQGRQPAQDARSAAEIQDTLTQIKANQAEYERIESSWRRWTPWGFRRQYQLVKANEPLFASIGVTHEPLDFEVNPGHTFGDWLVRKWLRV